MMRILLTLYLVFFTLPVIAQMDAVELLNKADIYRSPFTYTQLEIRIDEYKNGKIKKSRHYRVYYQNGQSLVSVLDGSNKGNRILLKHKGMFIAPKSSSRAVRITPIQRLLGQASYGDLAGLSFSENYMPTILKQTEDTITLELMAKKSSATYNKIILVIAQDDQKPISAQAYLVSGKLYKKMLYNVKDGTLKSITYTSKNKNKKTVMNFLSVKYKRIPKRLLTSRGMRNVIR